MTTCGTCGSQLTPDARFCASCGTAVAAQPTGVAAGYGLPTAASPAAATAPATTFASGDWKGAFLANAVGLAAMVLLSGPFAFSSDSNTLLGVSGTTTVATLFLYVAMAAGGSASMQAGFFGSIEMSFRPLTITLVGYGLLAWIFVRRLRRDGSPTARAWGMQVLRVAVVHLGVLVGVVLLSGIGGSSGAGDPDSPFGGPSDVDMSAGMESTVINGLLTLAVALLVFTLLRLPGLFPAWERARAFVAGPVRAMVFLTVASCVATAVAVVVLVSVLGQQVNEQGVPVEVPVRPDMALGELLLGLVSLLVILPNLAGYALLFGMGVPLKGNVITPDYGPSGASPSLDILDATRENAWLWIWPGVVLVLLAATGFVAARRSPAGASGRRAGWALGIVAPVALFVLAQSLGISASMGGALGSSFGFDTAMVLLLGGGYGLLFGLLGARFMPRAAVMGPVVPVGGAGLPTQPLQPFTAPPAPAPYEAAAPPAVPTSPAAAPTAWPAPTPPTVPPTPLP